MRHFLLLKLMKVRVLSLSCVRNAYISFGKRGMGSILGASLEHKRQPRLQRARAHGRGGRTQLWGVLVSFLSLLRDLECVTLPL